MPRDAAALAAMGTGNNVPGHFFTLDGNTARFSSAGGTIPGNTVGFSVTTGTFNALQQSDVGKLGREFGVAEGEQAARLCALNLLAHLRVALEGDLDRVVCAVRLAGFVNSTPDFVAQSQVMNGASDLFVEVLGDAGRHTRLLAFELRRADEEAQVRGVRPGRGRCRLLLPLGTGL